nr:MAG TPA: hypothetical protein [Caudoviricetes sp.]
MTKASGRAIIKPSKGERIPKKKEVNYNEEIRLDMVHFR